MLESLKSFSDSEGEHLDISIQNLLEAFYKHSFSCMDLCLSSNSILFCEANDANLHNFLNDISIEKYNNLCLPTQCNYSKY